MKRIGILAIAVVLGLGAGSCTNDEGDPEFEILNPEEETQGMQGFPEEESGKKGAREQETSNPQASLKAAE